LRIIAKKTLKSYWIKYSNAEGPIKAWCKIVGEANWKNHNDLKGQIKDASIISQKRVVFNLKGNKFRLVVDIEYSIRLVFVIWLGTHKEYDKIKVRTISYDKGN
jgi:mRNA interferase HigB